MTLSNKSLEHPDETRKFGHGYASIVNIDGMTVGRAVLEPGWRWSNDVKPLAGTESCDVLHTGYLVRGRLHVRADDGTSVELEAGDAYVIPPGHDAWVVGDMPAECVDWSGDIARFAQGTST